MVASGSVFSTILIARTIRGTARSTSADRLVDVGCGESPYRSVIEHHDYIGVDRRMNRDVGPQVVGDGMALPLATAAADVILCTEVIEHVPDERVLAAELARVAAPGGQLVLSAPFVHGLHEQPYDFRRLTSIGLVTTLERAGWEVDRVASIGGPVVVALDGIVRWGDSLWRRAVRALLPARVSRRLLPGPSAVIQRWLAAIVLRRSRYLGVIDPLVPIPRLTLGYVVQAHRSDGTSA